MKTRRWCGCRCAHPARTHALHPAQYTQCILVLYYNYPQRDDHRKKHGVWWAPKVPKDEVRHVLVFRWTNVDAKRAYHTEWPHRPVATGEP